MDDQSLEQYRKIWQAKTVLRAIYRDYYDKISASCAAKGQRTLEVGGGCGNFKAQRSGVVSTDLQLVPWLNLAADCQFLPFRDSTFSNVVGIDVLHHVERPVRFLREAERVLETGGRLVLLEPAITPVSRAAFALLHPEPVDMRADPLADGELSGAKRPFDANQAIATLLASPRLRARLEEQLPSLRIVESEWLSLFAYPLSGGFKRWSLLPAGLARPLLRFEERLPGRLKRLMSFRLLLVFEKFGTETKR